MSVVEYFTSFLTTNNEQLGKLVVKDASPAPEIPFVPTDKKHTKAVMTNAKKDVIVYKVDGSLNAGADASPVKSIALFSATINHLPKDDYAKLYGDKVQAARIFSSASEHIANAILFPYDLNPISTLQHTQFSGQFIQLLKSTRYMPTTSKASDLLYAEIDGNEKQLIVLPPFITKNAHELPWYLDDTYDTFIKAIKFEAFNGEVFEDWIMNELISLEDTV